MLKLAWKDFENKARKCLEKKLKCALEKGTITIKGKSKGFDLLNKKYKIIGDVKHYKNTKSGLEPSAKRSILNEYIWILQMLPNKWNKIIIIGEDYDMASKYIIDFRCWLKGITFYFYHRKNGLKLLKRA